MQGWPQSGFAGRRGANWSSSSQHQKCIHSESDCSRGKCRSPLPANAADASNSKAILDLIAAVQQHGEAVWQQASTVFCHSEQVIANSHGLIEMTCSEWQKTVEACCQRTPPCLTALSVCMAN